MCLFKLYVQMKENPFLMQYMPHKCKQDFEHVHLSEGVGPLSRGCNQLAMAKKNQFLPFLLNTLSLSVGPFLGEWGVQCGVDSGQQSDLGSHEYCESHTYIHTQTRASGMTCTIFCLPLHNKRVYTFLPGSFREKCSQFSPIRCLLPSCVCV